MDIVPEPQEKSFKNQEQNALDGYHLLNRKIDTTDLWDQPQFTTESPMRLRATSCPTKASRGPSRNLQALLHPYSMFSTSILNEEPELSIQIAEYNRKHDSWMLLELDKEVSFSVFAILILGHPTKMLASSAEFFNCNFAKLNFIPD